MSNWTNALLSAFSGAMSGAMQGKQMKETKELEEESRRMAEERRKTMQDMIDRIKEDAMRAGRPDPTAVFDAMNEQQKKAIIANLLTQNFTMFGPPQ